MWCPMGQPPFLSMHMIVSSYSWGSQCHETILFMLTWLLCVCNSYFGAIIWHEGMHALSMGGRFSDNFQGKIIVIPRNDSTWVKFICQYLMLVFFSLWSTIKLFSMDDSIANALRTPCTYSYHEFHINKS